MVGAFYEGGGEAVALTPPPYVDKGDLSSLCFQAVRKLIRTENKVLYFGPKSSIPGHIENLPQDQPVQIEKHPPVAALGYLSAALQLWLQLETIKKPKTYAQKIIEHVENRGDSFALPWTNEDDEGFFPDEEYLV